jgi:hypothetical protein
MIEHTVAWLQTLTFIQSTFMIPVFLGFMVFLLPYIRTKLGIVISGDTVDGCAEGFGAVALFFVFIAATSLSTVQGFQKDGAKVVDAEVAQITNLDRELVHAAGAEADKLRVTLKTYVQAIISDDWPAMADGGSAASVDRAMGSLMSQVNHITAGSGISAATATALFTRLEAVSDVRSERIEIANVHLSKLYWETMFIFLSLMLIISFFTHSTIGKRAALCGKMAAIGFTLVLVLQTDGVFHGDISIQPTSYVKALAKMKIRTADTD